ncbi:hypothetical protein [Cecembia calidifontis]|jgi:hypothetical protein|uniref:Uncharacterized protein n=1 Tax=Cecembia calidifontis TaxID=1187080 RepID=A0A4V2F6A0_9BACT|nr:hypothetical protein [Cecembia calidifontis]RZS95589.1 hypothetical protein BC751_1123 [Cecembia calidifontis]
MKRKLLSLACIGLFVGGLTIQNISTAIVAKGTLYGNSSGTKYCCKLGTNDCAAARCGGSNQ